MSKKKKKDLTTSVDEIIEMQSVTLYGSMNGWLKIIPTEGEEIIMRPKDHTDRDIPITWYKIGEYLAPISVEDNTDA